MLLEIRRKPHNIRELSTYSANSDYYLIWSELQITITKIKRNNKLKPVNSFVCLANAPGHNISMYYCIVYYTTSIAISINLT